MASTLQKLLLGAAFLFSGAIGAVEYPKHAESTRTTVTVNIVWLPNYDATDSICSFLMDHPAPNDGFYLACYNPVTHTIYAVEPTSFNDTRHLEVLGHEFWHALGAEHPE